MSALQFMPIPYSCLGFISHFLQETWSTLQKGGLIVRGNCISCCRSRNCHKSAQVSEASRKGPVRWQVKRQMGSRVFEKCTCLILFQGTHGLDQSLRPPPWLKTVFHHNLLSAAFLLLKNVAISGSQEAKYRTGLKDKSWKAWCFPDPFTL